MTPFLRRETAEPDTSSMVGGFFATIGLDVLAVLAAILILHSGDALSVVIFLMFLPLAQILWVLPLFLYAYLKGFVYFSKGVLLCAALKLLIFGACWAAMALK